MKKNQRGKLIFIAGLLILAVFILVGSIFWINLFVDKKGGLIGGYEKLPEKYPDNIDKYNGQPLPQTPTSTPTPTATVSKLQRNNIFAIPELGIKMQITGDIKDLIYSISYQDKNMVSVFFSTRSIVNLDKGCSPLDDPVGGIARTVNYHPVGENTGEAKKVGNYYYAITTPQAYCASGSNNENEGKLISKLGDSLRSAYQTVQPL